MDIAFWAGVPILKDRQALRRRPPGGTLRTGKDGFFHDFDTAGRAVPRCRGAGGGDLRARAGDGKADDYAAVKAAVEAAKALPAAVIRFRRDAVYRLSGPEGTSVAMELHHLKNCAFIGENTTLMLDGIIQYWDIVFCENILMQGFNLKFRIPPYTVSEVLEADYDTMTVLVHTRDSLGITGAVPF